MKRLPITAAFCISIVALAVNAVDAQGFSLKYATVSATASPKIVHPGSTVLLKILVKVSPGFHINSDKPNDPDLIPTAVSFGPEKSVAYGSPSFPNPKTISAPSLSQKPLSVFTGTAVILDKVTVSPSAKPGQYTLSASVSYQGCNMNSCYPPTSSTVNASVKVD